MFIRSSRKLLPPEEAVRVHRYTWGTRESLPPGDLLGSAGPRISIQPSIHISFFMRVLYCILLRIYFLSYIIVGLLTIFLYHLQIEITGICTVFTTDFVRTSTGSLHFV